MSDAIGFDFGRGNGLVIALAIVLIIAWPAVLIALVVGFAWYVVRPTVKAAVRHCAALDRRDGHRQRLLGFRRQRDGRKGGFGRRGRHGRRRCGCRRRGLLPAAPARENHRHQDQRSYMNHGVQLRPRRCSS